MDSSQHGFCSGKSVTTASVSFIESVIDSIDAGEPCVGIFMDLSKAFDTVDHEILLAKLKLLGLDPHSLNWFSSYLNNRYQFVQITHLAKNNRIINHKSELKPVKFGVPQGSVLGPLLFICYLKDISKSLSNSDNTNLCLYADDSNLKVSGNNLEQVEILSFTEIGNMITFFENHNLHLNIEKTNYISFKTAQSRIKKEPLILVNTEPIELVTSTKFLGLTIDNNLDWNKHVDNILAKINSGMYALRRMAGMCSESTLKIIYHSYIHSHISFGICLYGSSKLENLDKILKEQKKAIRIIKNLHPGTSCREHFKMLNILTVYGQFILDTIMIFLNNKKDTILEQETHHYNTRKKNEIIPTHHRLEFYTKKPSYKGASYFRKLPKELKCQINSSKFKLKLKTYLVCKVLYSIEEYMNN